MIAVTYWIGRACCGLNRTRLEQWFSLTTHLLAWSAIIFFASAGASAAYLMVSEIFPMEICAMAIAFFFLVRREPASMLLVVRGR